MPRYVPIQDLTIGHDIADTDYVPVSDGETTFAVTADKFKAYSTDRAEAAAESAESDAESAAASAAAAQAAVKMVDTVANVYGAELGTTVITDWVIGEAIATNQNPVDYQNPVDVSTYACVVLPCEEGDVFHIKVSGASTTYRPWCMIDAEGYKVSTADVTIIDRDITIKSGTAYLVCNARTTSGEYSLVKKASKITALQNDVSQLVTISRQQVVDSLSYMQDSDFEIGTLDGGSGNPGSSIYSIRTKMFYLCRDCELAYNGAVIDDGRYCLAYYYDRNFSYLHRVHIYGQGNVLTPDQSVYVKFVYGWASYVGQTVANYGFSNLVSDFGVKILNQRISSIDTSIDFIFAGRYVYNLSFSSGYIDPNTGEHHTNSNYHATGYLALPKGAAAVETNCHNSITGTDGYAFYDAANAYLSGGKCSNSGESTIIVPDGAASIRLSSRLSSEESGVDRYVIAKGDISTKSNTGYNIVMLGDSLIGNYNGADSVPFVLEQLSGAKCYNCAFGGSSMGTDTVGSINPNLLPFRGFKVIEAIVEDDYSEMEDVIAGGGIDLDYFEEHVNRLKEIDWSTVDIITLSYGINDFLSSVTLDNLSDTHDTNTTGGAFRVALETLWNTYPHIKVMICGPTWIGGPINSGALAWDSDNHQNSIGKYLEEYSELERAVAREYHVPFVEMYNYTNFNRFTWKKYYPTNGTNAIHPNAAGRFVMAKRYAAYIASL